MPQKSQKPTSNSSRRTLTTTHLKHALAVSVISSSQRTVTPSRSLAAAAIDNPRTTGEIVFRVAPVTGDATDLAEGLTGYDAFSGEKLTSTDLAITRATIALPLIPGKGARIVKSEVAHGVARVVSDANLTPS